MMCRRVASSFTAMFVFITSVCCLCGPQTGAAVAEETCQPAQAYHCGSHEEQDEHGCPSEGGHPHDQDHCCDHCQQTQFFEASHVSVLKPALIHWQIVYIDHCRVSSLFDSFHSMHRLVGEAPPSCISTPTLLRLHCALNT